MAQPQPNFNRMLQLIDEVFATRSDPGQIQVNRGQLARLQKIHPATLTELADENGPVIWLLLIPTTKNIMTDFLSGSITEKQLLERTKPGDVYDCIYLCSATTLPEYRGQGKTKQLCLEGIQKIQKDHPIKTLFVWPFTPEGKRLAEALAQETGLEIMEKSVH